MNFRDNFLGNFLQQSEKSNLKNHIERGTLFTVCCKKLLHKNLETSLPDRAEIG